MSSFTTSRHSSHTSLPNSPAECHCRLAIRSLGVCSVHPHQIHPAGSPLVSLLRVRCPQRVPRTTLVRGGAAVFPPTSLDSRNLQRAAPPSSQPAIPRRTPLDCGDSSPLSFYGGAAFFAGSCPVNEIQRKAAPLQAKAAMTRRTPNFTQATKCPRLSLKSSMISFERIRLSGSRPRTRLAPDRRLCWRTSGRQSPSPFPENRPERGISNHRPDA